MNLRNNQGLVSLVTEYEAMAQTGSVASLRERDFQKLIDYYEGEHLLDRALEVVNHAIGSYSYSIDFYVKKALLLLHSAQEDLAFLTIEHCFSLSPADPTIFILKARALVQLNFCDQAMLVLDDIRDHSTNTIRSAILVVEALIYQREEQYERMFYALKAALEEDPKNKEALAKLWTCIELTKQYESSISLHELIIDADPYNSLAWYNLGHVHAYLGNYNDAIEAYEYAFITDETFECAHRDCAELCFELKMYPKALDFYLQMLEIFNADSDLFLRIGQCYLNLGHPQKAITYFQQSIKIDPLNDEAFYALGTCHLKNGDAKRAIRVFEKAIRIEDEREEYYAGLGEAFFQAESYLDAESAFKTAIAIAPEDSTYWIHYATLLLEIDRTEEAITVLEDAEEHAVGIELLYCRVACLFKLGKRHEAIYWLGEALIEEFERHTCIFDLMPNLAEDADVQSLIETYRL